MISRATMNLKPAVIELNVGPASKCLLWVISGHSLRFARCPVSPKADISSVLCDVCFVPKADSCTAAKEIIIRSPRRPINAGGTLRPSALAVLRLRTSSNFVGCNGSPSRYLLVGQSFEQSRCRQDRQRRQTRLGRCEFPSTERPRPESNVRQWRRTGIRPVLSPQIG